MRDKFILEVKTDYRCYQCTRLIGSCRYDGLKIAVDVKQRHRKGYYYCLECALNRTPKQLRVTMDELGEFLSKFPEKILQSWKVDRISGNCKKNKHFSCKNHDHRCWCDCHTK